MNFLLLGYDVHPVLRSTASLSGLYVPEETFVRADDRGADVRRSLGAVDLQYRLLHFCCCMFSSLVFCL